MASLNKQQKRAKRAKDKAKQIRMTGRKSIPMYGDPAHATAQPPVYVQELFVKLRDAEVPMQRVALPPYVEGCQDDPQDVACDYPETELKKIVGTDWAASDSTAVDLVQACARVASSTPRPRAWQASTKARKSSTVP